MPCYDGGYSESLEIENATKPLKDRIKKLEAMLCALLSVDTTQYKGIYRTGASLIPLINEKEAGVKASDIRIWWENHQKQDHLRKKQEQKRKDEQRRRDFNEFRRVKKKLGL